MSDLKPAAYKRGATKTSNALRQAAYRERHRAKGKRQLMVWVIDADWQAGLRAGLAGQAAEPVPPGMDGMSWFIGWTNGKLKLELVRTQPTDVRDSPDLHAP